MFARSVAPPSDETWHCPEGVKIHQEPECVQRGSTIDSRLLSGKGGILPGAKASQQLEKYHSRHAPVW